METLLRQGRALNLYGLLNLEPTATNEEIREAYKALSRVFHPDRLRAQDAAESEQAKDFFVSIKAVYEVLSDPVYRFAYDTYGHEGIRYFMLCRQLENGPQFNQQQNMLSLNLSLHGEIQSLLQNDPDDRQIRLATVLLKSAMERYRQQVKLMQRRLRDSIVAFDAHLDLPCAFHPQAAFVAEEPNIGLPYLELEAVRLEFSVRTINQEQFIQNSNQQTKPETKRQRHLMSTTLGAKTDWTAAGKGDAEAFLEGTYKTTATSKTIWNYELRAPLTDAASSKKPITAIVSSTHEFLGGTVTTIGLQGNTATSDSWAYRFSSRRRLRLGVGRETDSASTLLPNVMASFAGAIDFFSCRPMLGVVTLTTIEQEQHDHSRQEEKGPTTNAFWSPSSWSCSTPILSIRTGYHTSPIHASIKYEEFGKPWASLDAAWSWNMAEEFSKIKVVLSADLWGLYEDNDTTTIRTGIKHDLLSGWIWLWEWEERDWTLKVPISLSHSKNAHWLALAMGMETLPSDKWHVSLGSLLAWFLAVQVAQTLLGDWVSNDNPPRRQERPRHSHSRDATFSEGDRRLRKQDIALGKEDIFRLLMVEVAHKKRAAELSTGSGLVIRSAKLLARKVGPVTTLELDTQTDEDPYNAIATSVTPVMEAHPDLTDTLQFWVRQGTLALPPLSSQSSTKAGTNYYSIGGMSDDTRIGASSDISVWYWINQLSQVIMAQIGVARKWLIAKHLSIEPQGNHVKDLFAYDMVIRYQHQGNVYEKSFTCDEAIVLPSSKALLLGPAATVT